MDELEVAFEDNREPPINKPTHTFIKAKHVEEEEKLEEEEKDTYLLKCKEIGRVGPPVASLDRETAYGSVKFYDNFNLDVEALS